MNGILVKYILPNGHQLFVGTNSSHGVIKAPFGCAKVLINDDGENLQYEILPGIYMPKDCMEWLNADPR